MFETNYDQDFSFNVADSTVYVSSGVGRIGNIILPFRGDSILISQMVDFGGSANKYQYSVLCLQEAGSYPDLTSVVSPPVDSTVNLTYPQLPSDSTDYYSPLKELGLFLFYTDGSSIDLISSEKIDGNFSIFSRGSDTTGSCNCNLIEGDSTVTGNFLINENLNVEGDSTSGNFHVNETFSQGTTNTFTFDFVPVKDSTYYLLDDIYAHAPNNHVAIHAFVNIMTTVCTIDGGLHNWYNTHMGQINCTHTSNFTGDFALTSVTFDGTGFTEPVGIYAPNDTGIDSSKLCLYATSPVGSTVSPARLVLINRLDAVNGVTVVDATVWAQVTYNIREYFR